MAVRDNSEKDKTRAELLQRALVSPAGVTEFCPDAEILAAYADRALDAGEMARYELHFSQCAHCREQLAAMSRAAAPAANAPRLSWIWTWGWIALAPVTAMLLIAAVLIARRPPARLAAEGPLVAMQSDKQGPAPSAFPLDSSAHSNASAKTQALPQAQPGTAARARPESSVAQGLAAPAPRPAESDREMALRRLDEKEQSRSSEWDYATKDRTGAQLDKAGSPPARQATTGGVQHAPNDAVRTRDQDVTIESAASSAEAQAPSQAANGAISSSVSGGIAAAPPVPAAASKKQEPSYTVATSNNLSAGQTVTVEAAADRDERTIVHSPDPQVLWRISGGRYVERSSDTGATWHAQWTSVSSRVVAGSAPSVETCWLVGSGGVVLLTTDGKNWRAVEPPAKEDFVAVAAADASSATITSRDGRKFETRDGGRHWAPAP